MTPTNIVTPVHFKDGREYVISISVSEHPSNPFMTLKVSDSITAEEYSCKFDSKYVETLTHRTGNFKPFHVFISMIKSALLKKSESVTLELMKRKDLESLRSRKGAITGEGRSGKDGFSSPHNNNGETTLSSNDHSSTGNGFEFEEECQNKESGSSKKKYLIVTYVAEFDRVHYPIPLSYSGAPNHQIMQNNIFQLRSELATLKNSKNELEDEVNILKQAQGLSSFPPKNHINSNLRSNDPTFVNLRHFQNENKDEKRVNQANVDLMKSRRPEDQLALRISNLEDKLCQERSDYENKIEKLQAENDFLRQKLEASEKYEERLEDEVYSLRKSKNFHYPSNVTTTNREHERGRARNVGFGDTFRLERTNRTNVGRIRSPTISPHQGRGRSRSLSPFPNRGVPSFDPTAYIREKKLRQEKMTQLRLDKINSQFRSRESSPSSERSRSHSRDSITRILLRNTSSENNPRRPRVEASRSPIPSRGQHTLTTLKDQTVNSALYNQIEERLGRRLASRRNSISPTRPYKSNLKQKTKTSLQTHVENIVRQEMPKLQRKQSRISKSVLQDEMKSTRMQ